MGILIPFILFRTSYKNILELFNKINEKFLELENQNKNDRINYENEIKKLKETIKKLEESLGKEKKSNQDLLKIKNHLENLNNDYEQKVKLEKESNNQKEKEIKNLHNNINEINKKFMNEKNKIIEKCKSVLKEKENDNKLLLQQIEEYKNNEKENNFKIKQLSQMIEAYKKQFKDYEIKNKLLEEINKKYSDLEKQNELLKNKLDELKNTNENYANLIKSYEIKISELKNENNDKKEKIEENITQKEMEKKIEMIKEKYEKLMKENINKTNKKLIKFVGDGLSTTKKKYEDFYKKREISTNSKFEEIKKLISISNMNLENKNKIIFNGIQNIEIKTSQYDINLDEEVNNLSKTQIIPIKKNINKDNINNNIINNNINIPNKEINNKTNIINIISNTPQGPDIIEKNEKINYNTPTPGGGKDENIFNDHFQKNSEYSFDCLNAMYLTSYIYQGTEEVKLEIVLKNNGNKIWHENTILKILDSSDLTANDIILSPQKPEEQKTYFVTFKNLGKYSPGEYQANLIFCSDGKRCGETLPIKIKIKEFNSQQNEIKENLDKINEFRDMFNLTEDEYPNERILETLQENDFNYEKAFSALFD
jgi:hypothetical protein